MLTSILLNLQPATMMPPRRDKKTGKVVHIDPEWNKTYDFYGIGRREILEVKVGELLCSASSGHVFIPSMLLFGADLGELPFLCRWWSWMQSVMSSRALASSPWRMPSSQGPTGTHSPP